jgi:hypothetical protein
MFTAVSRRLSETPATGDYMRFIPSFVHGLMDYIVGIALAASPWLLGFSEVRLAVYIAVILGLGAMLYSLLTNYELGVIRVIPFPIHLMIDFASGLFLFACPWLFGFSSLVSGPFITFGLLEMGAAALTNPHVVGLNRLRNSR